VTKAICYTLSQNAFVIAQSNNDNIKNFQHLISILSPNILQDEHRVSNSTRNATFRRRGNEVMHRHVDWCDTCEDYWEN